MRIIQIDPNKDYSELSKKAIVPDILTSNQKTVDIRIPDHPLTEQPLKLCGYPNLT